MSSSVGAVDEALGVGAGAALVGVAVDEAAGLASSPSEELPQAVIESVMTAATPMAVAIRERTGLHSDVIIPPSMRRVGRAHNAQTLRSHNESVKPRTGGLREETARCEV